MNLRVGRARHSVRAALERPDCGAHRVTRPTKFMVPMRGKQSWILSMNRHPISEGRVHESLEWLEKIWDSQARPSGYDLANLRGAGKLSL